MSARGGRCAVLVAVVLVAVVLGAGRAAAADQVTDGNMELAGVTNWPLTNITGTNSSAKATDQKGGGTQSLKGTSAAGKIIAVSWSNQQSVGSITGGSTVTLSFWYAAQFTGSIASAAGTLYVESATAVGGPWTALWSQALTPSLTVSPVTVAAIDVSANFASTATYYLRLRFAGTTGSNNTATAVMWWDDVVLNVAPPTLTLGNGIAGASGGVCPAQAAQKLDGFSLVNSSGAVGVTALTVTTTGQAAIASLQIWNEAGTQQYFTTVNNPGIDTWNFSGGTTIPVSTGAANFKVYATYKTDALAPAGNTATTAVVSAYTTTNAKAGSDTADTTLTLDNTAAVAATWGSNTAGDAQITLNWTYGTGADSVVVVRYTANTDTAMPVDGTTYVVGNAYGTGGTVRYVGTAATFLDNVGLSNGTAYYYRIFEYEGCGNFAATAPWSAALTPVAPTTTLANGVAGTTGGVCPAQAAQKLDGFSFVNSSGAVGVTALTVTTTGQAAIASLQIWNEAGTQQYFTTVNNPGIDTWNFSGGTTIPVSTGAANFKVYATYKTDALAPAGNTATTAVVSAYTTANAKAGSDTADTTLTLDNTAAAAATWGSNTAGDAQITLNWAYGTGGDSVVVVRYTANTDTAMPVDGTTYVVGTAYGTGGTVRYVGTAATFLDNVGLSNGTAYYYRIFEYDGCGNFAATAPWSGALTPNATTTLANGVAGTSGGVCPAQAAQKLDGFSFVNSSGAVGVTALTVTTTGQAAIASLQIWNEAGTTQYFTTVTNPGSDTWNFSGGTTIPVSTTVANFKVYATYKADAAAPGGTTATTAAVSAYTTANLKTGSDTADTTLTLDNAAAVAATWGSNTAGDAQVSLNWTYGTGADSVVVVRYTTNTDTAMPVDGTTYVVGNPYGTGGTVRYVGSLSTFSDTVGLTNGTTYYYRVFEYDGCANFAATAPWSGALTPVAPTTTLANGVAGTTGNVCPAAAAQKLDGFSLVNSSGSAGVTALTVTTTGQAAIASLQIWNEAGTTQYFTTVSNSGSDSWSFSGGTTIPVSTGAANFKIYATYKADGAAPAGNTTTTAFVSAYTTTNNKAGADSADTTLTLNNTAAAAATWGSNSAGDVQVSLNWTYGSGADSVVIVRYTANTDTAMPVDGTTYVVGNAYGTGGTVRYVGSAATFLDTVGLSNGTAYYYRIFESDGCGNFATTAPWSTALTPTSATTLANGVAGTTGGVCPAAAAQKLDGFSFVNATGTTGVTALTVTTTGQAAIASLQIWNEAGTTQYFTTVNNPGIDTWNFSGGVTIPVGVSLANFKVLAAYVPRATAPAGGTATTAFVSAFTTSNNKAGADTADTTLTLNNTPALAAGWDPNTPGNAQVTLNWTYGTPGDSVLIVRYMANTDTTMPVEGTTYVVGTGFGTGGTVRYVGSLATFSDTVGLINGTTYYYRIFEYDGCSNYAATAPWSGALIPNVTTTLSNGVAGTTGNVCPGAASQKLDGFSLVNATGAVGVTGLTVTTTGQTAIASLQIWNEAGTVQYFTTLTNAGSDTWNFSGGTTISLSTTPANFKVLATYDSHASAPAGNTATTAFVSGFTSANNKAGADTADTTLTLDNVASAATWGTNTGSPSQIVLNWSVGGGGDSVMVVRYPANTDTTMPVDGTSYVAGNLYGTGTVRYVGSASTFTDTTPSVVVGTTYYYRVFEYDGCLNYAATAPWSAGLSLAPTLALSDPGVQPAASNVTAGNSIYVGRFTLTANTGNDTRLTSVAVGNLGTALPNVDVLRLLLFDDTQTTLLGTSTWDGTNYRAVTNQLVTAGAPVTIRVVLVVASGATTSRTFRMSVAAASQTVSNSAAVSGADVVANTFTVTAGPTQGNANANAPTVLIVNPMDGATVTGPNFRVQVQVYNPGGLGALTGVTLSTNGGSTFPTTLAQVASYSVGANAAVYEATLTLVPAGYTLIARAANTVPLTSNSAMAALSVSAAKAGDGMLLVRDNSSQLCTDCHAMQTHSAQATGGKYGAWGVNCRDCHTPHNTTNIFLVKKSITPPAFVSYQPARAVKFSTRSGYDPTSGAATASFANADNTGPCQVCHQQTVSKTGATRYRSSGNTDTHYSSNGTEACTNCHTHATGFKGKTCVDCHTDPVADTDNWATDTIPAKVGLPEWTTVGHGLAAASSYASGNFGAGLDTQGATLGDRGCLYCHDDGVGHGQTANPFRLANTGLPEGLNGVCLVCHGAAYTGFDPDGANTAYASKDGAKNVNKEHYNNLHGPANNGGQYCWDCHDPHGDKSALGNTLWYMLHKVPFEKTVNQWPTVFANAIEFRQETGGNSAITPITSSTKLDYQDYIAGGLCKNCHADGVAAHFTKTYSDATHFTTNGASAVDAPNDRCTDCHKHIAGFKPLACNGCHNSPSAVGKHRSHNNVSWQAGSVPTSYANLVPSTTAADYGFACNKCHSGTHQNQLAVHAGTIADPFPVEVVFDTTTLPSNPTATYVAVYKDTVVQGTDTTKYFSATTTTTATNGQCTNAYCHSNAAPLGGTPAYQPVQWGQIGSLTCSSCHVVPGVTASASHTTHVSTYGFSCQRCHVTTTNNGTTITDKRNHVDGVKTLAFDTWLSNSAGTYASGTATCSNTYCHSNGQTPPPGPYVSGPSIAWNTTRACDSCHAGTMANTTKMSSGKHTNHINNVAVLGTNLRCDRCHSSTVNSSEAVTTPANHVNGSKTVTFTEAGTYSTPPTCGNVYCHSSGQATPAFRTVAWNEAAWTTVCDKCHGTEAANFGAPAYASGLAGSATANSHTSKHISSAADCTKCHNATTTDGVSIASASTSHLNGTREVVLAASLDLNGAITNYDGVSKTCSSVSCHGSGTPVWGSVPDCGACHSGNNALLGAHSRHWEPATLTTNATATLGSTPTTYQYGCGFCHPSGAGNHASGWVTPGVQAAQILFSGALGLQTVSGSYVAGATSAGTDRTFSFTAGTCSSVYCHSNAAPVGGTNSTKTPVWTSTTTCASCHNTAAKGDTAVLTDLSAAHGKHIQSTAGETGSYAYTCDACHAGTIRATPNSPWLLASADLVNKANHVNGQNTLSFSSTLLSKDQSAATYSPSPNYTCSSSYCHSAGTSFTAPFGGSTSLAWTGTTTCTSCHGAGNGAPAYASGSPKANTHPKHAAYTCQTCHSGVTTGTGPFTIANQALHVNGAYTLVSANFTVQAGTGTPTTPTTCNSISCHGNNSATWGTTLACTACHGTTGVETDDLGPTFWSNGITATINTTEWAWSGHGKTGVTTYDVSGNPAAAFPTTTLGTTECLYCHDGTVTHGTFTNPFRLRGAADATGLTAAYSTAAPNAPCLNCHNGATVYGVTPGETGGGANKKGTKFANATHDGTKHTVSSLGGAFCWDCHDPHGDRPSATNTAGNNIFMIQRKVVARQDGVYGYPNGIVGAERNVTFFDITGLPAASDTVPTGATGRKIELATTPIGTDHVGLCQACHDSTVTPSPATAWTKYWERVGQDDPDGTGGNAAYNSGRATTSGLLLVGHNTTATCITCHKHAAKFAGAGGDCLSCHGAAGGAGTTGANNRRPVTLDFGKKSHHVGNGGAYMGGTLTNYDCVVCHAEGTIDGTGATAQDARYHNPNTLGIIDLKNNDSVDPANPTVFSYDKNAVAASAGLSGLYNAVNTSAGNWGSANAVWRTQTSTNLDPFCLTCHDSNGSSTVGVAQGEAGATAQNPFKDLAITNEVDGANRGSIVDIKSKVTATVDADGTLTGGVANDSIPDPPQGIASRHAIRGQAFSVYKTYTGAGSIYTYGGFVSTTFTDPGLGFNNVAFGPVWNDTSVMGCADCHTSDGANTINGNAHGSNQEYLTKDSTGLAPTTLGTAVGSAVCFRCHNTAKGYNNGSTHAGSTSNYADSTGLPPGNLRGQRVDSNAPLLGLACMNCHGGLTFGGLHGTSTTYAKGKIGAVNPYFRFMNGGAMRWYDPTNWSASVAGCYTLAAPDAFSSCTSHGSGKTAGGVPPLTGRPLRY